MQEPLHPGFDWPFGDCVLSTEPLFFSPVLVDKGRNPHVLPRHESEQFQETFRADRDAVISRQVRKRQEAADCSSEYWINFSISSTCLPIQPGHFFRPIVEVSALVSYSIAADINGTRKELEQDRKHIKRLLARFYRLSTERTIRWALAIQNTDQGSFILSNLNDSILDLTCPALVDFSVQLERRPSPDRIPVSIPTQVNSFEESAYEPWPEEPAMTEPKMLAPPPILDINSVRVIYFDVYDTLIDRETGIFTALRPLLNRSSYGFSRREALSFFFESEMEMKYRAPGATYVQILADTYEDVALRLGITSGATDAFLFTQSVQDWRCIPDASWFLCNLARNPRLSIVAISDVDHDFLLQTRAFASLAPFFEAVFTWDVCHAYKPDLAVFDAPLRYYDAQGVPRAHSYLVSGGLLRDLEPARELGVPAVWMRYPSSLAASMHTVEDASPAGTFGSLFHLGTGFLEAGYP
ncbi:HAD-like domain-containing protein [Mycena capillaripes]|nr:HAD-like domain-containing protein [Mycena capillaripes]